jgi:hypothetical protein
MHECGDLQLDICAHDAARSLNNEIIEWIVSITDDRHADVCCESLTKGDIQFTEWLLYLGYKMNGPNCLEGVIESGVLSVVKWAFEHQDPPYSGGKIALSCAAHFGNIDIFKYLIRKDFQFDREDCLKEASEAANLDIVEYITQYL